MADDSVADDKYYDYPIDKREALISKMQELRKENFRLTLAPICQDTVDKLTDLAATYINLGMLSNGEAIVKRSSYYRSLLAYYAPRAPQGAAVLLPA